MNLTINRSTFVTLLFTTTFLFPSVAQNKAVRLFHIERNKNQNIVCYDLNLADGKINSKKPIVTYWISHPDHKKSDLSFIENKLAYGAKSENTDPNTVVIKMNALKEPEITVTRNSKTEEIISIAKVNGKTMRLEKISIIAKPPHYTSVERVDIYGTSTSNGEKIMESIKQ